VCSCGRKAARRRELKNTAGLLQQVSDCILKKVKKIYIRFRMAHNVKPGEITESLDLRSWLSNQGLFLKNKCVQSKITTRCGWMLGSHPSVFNTNNMCEVIDSIPPFNRLQYKFCMQKVSNDKDAPKAAIIYCNWQMAAQVLSALRHLYSPKKEGFPLGIQMSFFPLVNTRSIMTHKTRKAIDKVIRKQKAFLKKFWND